MARDLITASLQYFADFLRYEEWAIRHKNAEAQAALVDIKNQWFAEMTNTPLNKIDLGKLNQKQAVAIGTWAFMTEDPFHDSRQMMHDFSAKYGVR